MSENGRIVLPAAIRRASDVRPKEVLTVRVDDEGIHIQTRRQSIRQAQAVVRKFTKGRPGLVQEFLSERREEAASDSLLRSSIDQR
jgi:bifunctional DNA-binding transcriptional regulator/antitoxin component of YhaV-PrlF toxin-antitoxin module